MRKALSLPAVLLIALSACGSDKAGDSASATTAAASASATTAADGVTTTAQAGTGSASTVTGDTAPAPDLATEMAKSFGTDPTTTTCLTDAVTKVLGPDALESGALGKTSVDDGKTIGAAFVECGFIRSVMKTSASDVGVQLSDAVLECIDSAATKNADIRASIDAIFVQDAAASDPSDILRQITKDCGVSDADMAKLDAA